MTFAAIEDRAASPVVCIRPVAESEIDSLLDMMTEFNRLEAIAWNRVDGAGPVRTLRGDPSLGEIGIVTCGDAIAGYFVLTWGFDLEWGGRDAFVTEFFVRSEVRGQRVGARMLRLVEQLAREKHVHALHLMVRHENTPAIALYERAGFAEPPRRFMTKAL